MKRARDLRREARARETTGNFWLTRRSPSAWALMARSHANQIAPLSFRLAPRASSLAPLNLLPGAEQ